MPVAAVNPFDPGVRRFQGRGRRFIDGSVKVTRTVLGEMHCTVRTYRIGEASADSEHDVSELDRQQETETTFSLVPSWWVMKFGLAKIFKLDIMEFSSQVWQAKMSSFNVCSLKPSAIEG